ncbi:hypothetical protein [Nocardioides litoris]|uniref:hypothetical protein n=1 Tax=Nocardioides litoris TaxID=1926648 RepID=UPI00112248B1|nr:hypothetical protein [Nocardioides litoris]
MTLTTWILCVVATAAVAELVHGTRRWHAHVTSQVRPDAAEPTETGYQRLAQRDLVVAVVALALAVPTTWDRLHTSDEELLQMVSDAVLASPADGLDGNAIRARVALATGRDDVRADYLEDSDEADEADVADVAVTSEYEVRLASREGSREDHEDQPAVCVTVTEEASRDDVGRLLETTWSVSVSPCS